MASQTLPNDPEEMKIASDSSWLCKIFQENKFDVFEKKKILKRIVKDIRKEKEEFNA